ncbi:hypothetical protein DL239_21520 [Sedimentitalea sp. CY04]|uniref:Uncharacterized protein n=1 Tax=Parasedimentitalea denitrificans TaxID=2211118 RepID=A0ABX0WCV8_9RHOB|nr:hypothetical protein [Sedimentitalea sp. CY04]
MSPGELTTALCGCGYSKVTSSAATAVFTSVIEALREGGFPDVATDSEVQDALRQIRKIVNQLV